MCGEQIQLAENSVSSGVLERWRAPGALALLCALATACGGKVGDISGDGASDLATGGRTRNGPHDGASGDLAAGGTIAAGGTLAAGGTIATGGLSQTGGIDVSESPIAPCEFIAGLENDTCTPTTVAVQRPPQNVLLVLDKSGTLADTSPYGRPKWEVLTAALNEALNEDDLYGGDELSLGLMLFPAQEVPTACMLDECCVMPEYPINVEIGPARETVPVILDVLDATDPSGLTPTAAALELAQMYFESGAGSMLEGESYVLLVSDGGPNCNSGLACSDDACTLTLDGVCSDSGCCADQNSLWCVDSFNTEDRIDDLATMADVRTLVVPLPGFEPYADWYSDFAAAGRAPAPEPYGERGYWDVSADGGRRALADTFKRVFRSLTRSCTIPLTKDLPGASYGFVNVAIDCIVVPRDGARLEGAAGAETVPPPRNWSIEYANDSRTLKITGAYCGEVQKGVDRIDIIAGCPTSS
ncbi:MAG: hypothetical protein JW751_25270 [Polyangiaceae bacterium]|nr:hypothetical protein [Polyangiaceae bacterium]